MDNINENKAKLYLGILLLLFMAMLSIMFSFSDYVGFFKGDGVITFSWKSAGAIWFSPVLIYLAYLLYRISLGNMKRLNSKIGDYVSYVSIAGFILTLFVSFYVDDKLKTEGYITCSKSSWMAPNKYVKDISLCK
ncbi:MULTISPECIES: DUF1240 domain-containing protein [Photorhabdus]|uniref:Membrane protein n=2 Tax=Photorhabdus asymbiotica TaxID=291112 RepID=B6VMH3_PHOAA|nr:DUF1240 domain-containing protein [Photorhabdus asymbiotica]RKS57794.1 uncharacterized protein DUF1240 [Photorhabdus asymbiotica]CAQ82883.1 putative membrane protein [Photorhabdus asymbiotica]CAR67353.1 putative membrane protein [Photorhabdus asymbiotica subsp. asymbiotica ATCC 43949]